MTTEPKPESWFSAIAAGLGAVALLVGVYLLAVGWRG